MSIKLDGKKLSLKIEERLTDYISSNKTIAKRAPGLAVIRIGEDPASGVYVKNKEKACSRIGIKSFIFHLKDSVEQKEVEQLIIKLNSDKDIDGMLLQLPIPWDIIKAGGIIKDNGLIVEAKANFIACTTKRREMIKIICLEEIVGFSFFETNIKIPEVISISVKVKSQEKISVISKGEIRSNL